VIIGKTGKPSTSISTSDASSITVRGKDLCADVMGHMTFTEYFFLLSSGKEPSEQQRYFLDVLLVAIAEHGLVPTNQVARMTYDAAPDALQGAVAAGLLGCGSVVLGTAELCGEFLMSAREKTRQSGTDPREAISGLVGDYRDSGRKLPGFGHPLHRPVDPRTVRIFELANEKGLSGPYSELARLTDEAVKKVWPKPLPMNVSMAIAAILLDLDFPRPILKAIPLLARTASLLAHLAEENANPIGFLMAHHAETAIAYEDGNALDA